MSRKTARDTAMKMLYEWSLIHDTGEDSINNVLYPVDLTQQDHVYLNNVVDGVKEHAEDIDALIARYAVGWKIERMSKVDLAVLRLAFYELLYRDDIPASVTVNEAVELAKSYGTDDSASFINGLLGQYLRQKPSADKA